MVYSKRSLDMSIAPWGCTNTCGRV